jgi:hypothetical protein
MLEEIVDIRNVQKALKQVTANKGAGGIDGMQTDELRDYLNTGWQALRAAILESNYKPQAVRKVEIPKPQGGTRMLGIPTVTDRLLQQAIAQWLSPKYEEEFSNYSYGFRKGRNAHQAVLQAQSNLNEGYEWVIELDLEKFFDRVNHDKLMGLLAKKIADKGTLKLIRSYLNSGIMEDGVVSSRTEGTPQGSPLGPRTHPQTLCFRGVFWLKEGDFDYCYIKSSIFMKHGTISELRINQAGQSNLQFIEERDAAFTDCGPVNGDVWDFPHSSLSLYPKGSGESGKGAYPGGYCRIHCKTSSQFDQKDQKICTFPRNIYQQSGPNCVGRVPVKEGSWQKRRDKLKYRIATIVCGSKSSLRCTNCLFQPIIVTSPSLLTSLLLN